MSNRPDLRAKFARPAKSPVRAQDLYVFVRAAMDRIGTHTLHIQNSTVTSNLGIRLARLLELQAELKSCGLMHSQNKLNRTKYRFTPGITSTTEAEQS